MKTMRNGEIEMSHSNDSESVDWGAANNTHINQIEELKRKDCF